GVALRAAATAGRGDGESAGGVGRADWVRAARSGGEAGWAGLRRRCARRRRPVSCRACAAWVLAATTGRGSRFSRHCCSRRGQPGGGRWRVGRRAFRRACPQRRRVGPPGLSARMPAAAEGGAAGPAAPLLTEKARGRAARSGGAAACGEGRCTAAAAEWATAARGCGGWASALAAAAVTRAPAAPSATHGGKGTVRGCPPAADGASTNSTSTTPPIPRQTEDGYPRTGTDPPPTSRGAGNGASNHKHTRTGRRRHPHPHPHPHPLTIPQTSDK
ncbi:hypothetical protein OK074_9068, partial [Actinobacteria bacterium OK074]